MQDFKKYKDFLVEYINSGKVILMTGNSFEMLGKQLQTLTARFMTDSEFMILQLPSRTNAELQADIVYTSDILTKPIVGFVNKCSEIKGIENHLFTVKHGLGDYENAKAEGLKDKNLFATHVTGPIMIKNPHFLEYIALQISKIRMASSRVRITLTMKERATKILSANSQKDLRSKF